MTPLEEHKEVFIKALGLYHKEFGSLSPEHDQYAMNKIVDYGYKECRLRLCEIREIMKQVINIKKDVHTQKQRMVYKTDWKKNLQR